MKITKLFKELKPSKILSYIFMIISTLFFIFSKFIPLNLLNEELVSQFSFNFVYYLDIIPLSILLIIEILFIVYKIKTYYISSLILLIISTIIFIVYGIILKMMFGFFFLLAILYLLNLGNIILNHLTN